MVTGTGTTAVQAPVSTNAVLTDRSVENVPSRKSADNRRSNKPIMEKRRRARINNCLNELKALILDAMKKDPARHSKLEKADILEMTVKHLENLQRQQVAMSAAADPAVLNKFRAGFSECAGEVGRFPGLEPAVKRRLLQHLANCLAGAAHLRPPEQPAPVAASAAPAAAAPTVQLHILPTPGAAPAADAHVPVATHNGIIFSNGSGVHLVPTRLPNGDIALVLPATAQQPVPMFRQSSPAPSSASSADSPLPMLVPIPTRTASTASAASCSASSTCSSYEQMPGTPAARDYYSAPASPEPMDVAGPYDPPSQKPLSLVMRKTYEPADEDKPWRPW